VALLAGHFLVGARQKELSGGVIESGHVLPTHIGVAALAIGGKLAAVFIFVAPQALAS
jgi:hypothetical protein